MVTILLGQGSLEPHYKHPDPSNRSNPPPSNSLFKLPLHYLSHPPPSPLQSLSLHPSRPPPHTKQHPAPKRAARSTTPHQLSDRKIKIPPDRFGSISLARSVPIPVVASPMSCCESAGARSERASAASQLAQRDATRWDEMRWGAGSGFGFTNHVWCRSGVRC